MSGRNNPVEAIPLVVHNLSPKCDNGEPFILAGSVRYLCDRAMWHVWLSRNEGPQSIDFTPRTHVLELFSIDIRDVTILQARVQSAIDNLLNGTEKA
jgi:hypothetical protein